MKMSFLRASGFRGAAGVVRGLAVLLATLTGHAQTLPLPQASSISILAPPSGSLITVPGRLVFEAQAVDPLGDIRHVDFFANGTFIGASDYLLKIAVIPGRPIPHRLEWKVTEPGAYRVVARGKDTAGKEVVSKPVELIAVATSDLLPMVSVVATREATSEPRPEARIAPGQIAVRRSGPLEQPLTVHLLYGGSATAGLDYTRLPNEVVIPRGASMTTLDVVALDDDLVEGDETVGVEIIQPPIPIDPLAAGSELPRPTYRIDGERAAAKVVIHDADRADDASISLGEPRAGQRFPAGETITLKAVAMDPKGAITRLEFFSGEQSIGVSEILFIREPDPGTPIEHRLEWKGAKAGEHLLSARGRSAAGLPVESAVVPILVGEGLDPVVLEVEAVDPRAAEPTGTSPADVGTILIRRVGGSKNVAVPVFYSVDGSASNGVDYERLSGQVELPAGAEAVRVVVRPLADRLTEGEEKVVLELEAPVCPAIFPPPPQCYRMGASRSAAVVIHDGSTPVNQRPVVKLVSPRTGASFMEGEPILIRAEASDADGTVALLEVVADGVALGSEKDGEMSLEWKNAAPGLHRLSARAVDDEGAQGLSSVVTVVVQDAEDVAFVRRDLPPAYLPEANLEVVLNAEPPRGAGAWTVEETPPAGWAVSDVSDEGVFDAVTGRVKFGPYTDPRARRLSYRVAVPASATGVQTFSGRSSLDGRGLPVAGDGSVRPAGEHHPADRTPADKRIVADELTAYAAAWKRGRPWGDDEGLIPLPYVTRAGLIWKSGEAYRFDSAAGAPPACWVPGIVNPSGLALAGVGHLELRMAEGAADRQAAALQRPGAGGRIEILVQPPKGTAAVAVEERVPAGWSVDTVSDEGVWDPFARRIRWGLFFGDSARRLSYVAVPPAGQCGDAPWGGLVSYDGIEVAISGVDRLGVHDEATQPRIRGSRREGRGTVRFQVDAALDQVLVIEASDDLRTWSEIGVAVQTGEEIEVEDRHGDTAPQRYYRLRPVIR